MRNKISAGFTLIELLIVIAVVAILSAMAIANYSDYVIRSKLQEPASLLNDLRAKLELYYLDNRHYGPSPSCGISVPLPTEAKYFNYICTSNSANALGGQGYVIEARGIPGTNMYGFVMQIDQSNTKRTLNAGGWLIPKTDCWVQNKSGDC